MINRFFKDCELSDTPRSLSLSYVVQDRMAFSCPRGPAESSVLPRWSNSGAYAPPLASNTRGFKEQGRLALETAMKHFIDSGNASAYQSEGSGVRSAGQTAKAQVLVEMDALTLRTDPSPSPTMIPLTQGACS
jgi:hypothetical protein